MKCRFLKHILPVVFMFCGFVNMKADISKAEIMETLNHIQRLSAEQRAELTKANQDYQSQGEELIKQKELSIRYQAQAVQAEKERDALIWIFSIACGSVALSTFRSALQVIQMPWQLIALAGVFAGGFSLGFSIGRWLLRFLAEFTPHLPF